MTGPDTTLGTVYVFIGCVAFVAAAIPCLGVAVNVYYGQYVLAAVHFVLLAVVLSALGIAAIDEAKALPTGWPNRGGNV